MAEPAANRVPGLKPAEPDHPLNPLVGVYTWNPAGTAFLLSDIKELASEGGLLCLTNDGKVGGIDKIVPISLKEFEAEQGKGSALPGSMTPYLGEGKVYCFKCKIKFAAKELKGPRIGCVLRAGSRVEPSLDFHEAESP